MLEQLKKDLRNLKAKQRRCDFVDRSIALQKEIDEVKKLIELEKIKETPLTTFLPLYDFWIFSALSFIILLPNARNAKLFKSQK